MENPQHSMIVNDICSYVDEYDIKDLLKEYLKRVVLAKPKDPLRFLIDSIQENPYIRKSAFIESSEEQIDQEETEEEAGEPSTP